MITIGVDPSGGEKGNGVAVYDGGRLNSLCMKKNVEIVRMLENLVKGEEVIFSIENVLATNAVYTKHITGKKKVDQSISLRVGRCQQSQRELMWWLDDLEIPYVLHKPSSEWKKNENMFKRMTGWSSRSNEDTRSAAYFGWLQAYN